MSSRRRFLATLPALLVWTHAFAEWPTWPVRRKKAVPPLAPLRVYFGTDTNKGISKGIYQARFDSVHGQLTAPVLAAATVRPSYLAASPLGVGGHRSLYAVNAIKDPGATVTTFAIDPNTGGLGQLGQVSSGGSGPAYVSVDSSGRSAFVADYYGSSVASYRVQPDGALSGPVERIDFKDKGQFGALGSNTARQDAPHPHCATVSPDNRFLLVCDLGTDHISVFQIHPETGRLSDHALFSNNRPGSGPRHVVFHPNGRWVYCINEIDSTIDHCLWTATRFADTPQGLLVNTNMPVKTIAADFAADKNTAAELAVSGDGNYLYASNRGEDTLVVFSIRARDGRLSPLQRIACGGRTPRHFTLDPTGQWLLCGNEDSGSVTVFRRDGATGRLSGPVQTMPLDSPLMTLFA